MIKDYRLIAKRYAKLYESSPNTVMGSKSEDLITSKKWLLEVLSNIKRDFSVIYILGSWYGNLSKLISESKRITCDKIINVDKNEECLKDGYHAPNIEEMHKDANTLDYRQLDKYGVIINTSINDMKGTEWFNKIPSGIIVVLMGRNNNQAINNFESTDDILKMYPLKDIVYKNQKTYNKEGEGNKYTRYLVIGYK